MTTDVKYKESYKPCLYIISCIGSDIKQPNDMARLSTEIYQRLLFASAKPRNPGICTTLREGRLYDLIVPQPRKTSRVPLSLPLSRSCLYHRAN